MITITGRQKAFLKRFLDLYNQAQESLHYAHVAEVLGMGKITAYDMLRSLKERGLVRAEYVLRGKGQGAGRSTVLFLPTAQAHNLFAELTGEDWDKVEWEAVKARILDALRQRNDYQNLLEEILARLPQQTTPLVYAAEMATAVILNLLLVEKETPASALPVSSSRVQFLTSTRRITFGWRSSSSLAMPGTWPSPITASMVP